MPGTGPPRRLACPHSSRYTLLAHSRRSAPGSGPLQRLADCRIKRQMPGQAGLRPDPHGTSDPDAGWAWRRRCERSGAAHCCRIGGTSGAAKGSGATDASRAKGTSAEPECKRHGWRLWRDRFEDAARCLRRLWLVVSTAIGAPVTQCYAGGWIGAFHRLLIPRAAPTASIKPAAEHSCWWTKDGERSMMNLGRND